MGQMQCDLRAVWRQKESARSCHTHNVGGPGLIENAQVACLPLVADSKTLSRIAELGEIAFAANVSISSLVLKMSVVSHVFWYKLPD